MISGAITLGIIFTLWVAIFEPVYELPWGIHDDVEAVILTMNALANAAPWLATILNVLIIGLIVSIGLWLFDKVLWLIQIFRG